MREMKRWLHVFQTENTYQDKRVNDYDEPWVSVTVEAGERVDYDKSEEEWLREMPMTFEILSDGIVNWQFTNNSTTPHTIEYKINDGEWTSLTSVDTGNSFSVVSGDSVQFRGTNATYDKNGFSGSTCRFNVKGNIMSLINASDFLALSSFTANQVFMALFQSTSVVDASKLILPAMTLRANCYDGMFGGCSVLEKAPFLPATTLANYCYSYMFSDCPLLTEVTDTLPAASINESAYQGMFYKCSSLEKVPKISATNVGYNACYRMFRECTSLAIAPEMSLTTLGYYSCKEMFYGCTNLLIMPDLPATTLPTQCYMNMFNGCKSLRRAIPRIGTSSTTVSSEACRGMFEGCGSLVSAPELPATTLGAYCYHTMFNGCSALTAVTSELPATALTSYCYNSMFNNCKSLTTIPVLKFKSIVDGSCAYMFQNCAGITNYTMESVVELKTGNSALRAMFYGCTSLQGPTSPVTISGQTASSEALRNMFEGCTAMTSAPAFELGTVSSYCCINMFKDCISLSAITMNSITGVSQEQAFNSTFYNCQSLTKVTDKNDNPISLGASDVSIGNNVYRFAFYNCKSLVTPPTILAYNIGTEALTHAFEGCTSLVTTPTMHFNNVGDYSMVSMFNNCSSLTSTSLIIDGNVGQNGLANTFTNCISLTGVTGALGGSAGTIKPNACRSMFQGCTALTVVPDLPILTMASECYIAMFNGCSSLTTAPVLPATTLASNCYASMFQNCTSLTGTPVLSVTTLVNYCYNSMFVGCTSLTTAPDLPATTLTNSCYSDMFRGCTNLNYIKCNAETLASNCFYRWVEGVQTVSGTFVKSPNIVVGTGGYPRGNHGIPNNWTVVDAS